MSLGRVIQPPIKVAAWWYQRSRKGGTYRPSMSVSPRCTNTGSSAGRCTCGPAGRRFESPKTIACTRANTAAKATASASSSTGVAHGSWRIALVRIRNSLANTPNGGIPRIASAPSTRPQPSVGLACSRPRMSSMICEPARCVAWPTAKKMADLVSECTVMCSSPAKLAIGPPRPKAKVISPMCSIDE